jgi:tetratricopeptide (TPR) repeat protein
LLVTAAYVSASNQGQRSAEIVERMLGLPKLDSAAVSAGIMALVSAEVRLGKARARQALREIEKLALRFLTTALHQDPTAAEILYNLARQCLRHETTAALSFYGELLRTDPSYDERWYFHRDLGLIHYDHGDHERAAEHYDRACHLKDSDSELFRFAGHAYYYRGYWADALLRYERALAIEPIESYFLDAKVSFCRARIRTGNDRDGAFRRKRDLSHRLSGYAAGAAESGRRWLAQPLFRIARRLCELSFDADSWLGLYANRRGAYTEAAGHLRDALAVKPENPLTRLNLVMNLIFQNGGQFDKCARTHARISIFHGGPETLNQFRLRLTNTENKDELCEQFRQILEVVRTERDGWVERRREVLKPEVFRGVMHVEIRP